MSSPVPSICSTCSRAYPYNSLQTQQASVTEATWIATKSPAKNVLVNGEPGKAQAETWFEIMQSVKLIKLSYITPLYFASLKRILTFLPISLGISQHFLYWAAQTEFLTRIIILSTSSWLISMFELKQLIWTYFFVTCPFAPRWRGQLQLGCQGCVFYAKLG